MGRICGAEIHSADLSVTVSTAVGAWQLGGGAGAFYNPDHQSWLSQGVSRA